MESQERGRLQESLATELARVAQSESLDPQEQALWLLAQIENYLERWLAFRGVSTHGQGLPLQNDPLFVMIAVAAEMLASESDRAARSASSFASREFLNLLERGQAEPDAVVPSALRESLKELRASIESTGHDARWVVPMRLFVHWFLVENADKAEAKKISDAVIAGASLDAWPHLATGVIDGMDLNKLESLLRPKKVKGEPKRPGVGGKHLMGGFNDKPIVSHINDSFLAHLVAIEEPDQVVERWLTAEGLEKCKPAEIRKLLDELIQFAKKAQQKRKPVIQVDVP